MAEVFLARLNLAEESPQFYVIKKILQNSENTDFVKFFKEEIKIAKNLNHKNIVQFVDYGNENDQLYIVMEFLNGQNLKSAIADFDRKGQKMPIDHILYLISEVALGLDSAHRATDSVSKIPLNIIHRDMSPHNIMLTFDGSIKIIDFGIARAALQEEATKTGLIKGKFSYMSPEQVNCENLDSRTDIFALGIVLWELLTSKRLFKCENINQTVQKIQETIIPPIRSFNPEVDEELENIVLKSLAQNKLQRYQTMADFQFEINKYLILKYPHFRPHHFNESIKQFYSAIIEKRTEKLKVFSRVFIKKPAEATTESVVEFKPIKVSDDTLLNKTKPFNIKSESSAVELPEGFDQGAPTKKEKTKKAKSNLNFQTLNNKNPFATNVIAQSKQKAAHFYSSKNINNSIHKNDINNFDHIFNNSFLNNFKHLFLLLAFFYGLYSFYKYVNKAQVTESASLATLPPLTARTPPDTTTTNKTAQAKNSIAYLNISLEISNPRIRIFIDNRKVNSKMPILNYPIYANKPIKVTAYDPKTNYFDEKKIIAEAGKTLNLQLKLVPYSHGK